MGERCSRNDAKAQRFYVILVILKHLVMKPTNTILIVVLLMICFAFKPYHHGWANYDQEKVLDYTGVIQESTYENPHATARVKVKKKVWLMILAPVSRMEARGMNADMIKKGNTVRVIGYPHKEIKDEMRIERIFINDTKYELR